VTTDPILGIIAFSANLVDYPFLRVGLMVRASQFEPSRVVRLICVQVHTGQGIQKETAALLCEAMKVA